MKNGLGAETEMVPGSGGIFDVEKDGDMVFSKHEKGRFPETGEVLALLK